MSKQVNTYAAQLPDGTQETVRSSRTYTHAVAIKRITDEQDTNWRFGGSFSTEKGARDRVRYWEKHGGFHAEIVPVMKLD